MSTRLLMLTLSHYFVNNIIVIIIIAKISDVKHHQDTSEMAKNNTIGTKMYTNR